MARQGLEQGSSKLTNFEVDILIGYFSFVTDLVSLLFPLLNFIV